MSALVKGLSWASTERVRRVMVGNRSRDTKPELAVRRAVHALGLRYRVGTRPLPSVRRTADLVFTRRKVAVFVDGCFWHGCPIHCIASKTNVAYWEGKISANIQRDSDTDRRLREADWIVIRIWSHEDPERAAEQVRNVVLSRCPKE
nr:very short patch repair endonuclease [Cryobacterium glucosi]